ncbi:MAG: OmpA family protein [Gemmatimonadaceae bacterium]
MNRLAEGVMRLQRLAVLLTTAVVMSAVSQTGSAQMGGLRKKAEEAAKKKLEEASKKAAADSAKAKAADSAKAADTTKTPAGAPAGAPNAAAPSAATKSDPKVWENYDFVPGSKVIFYTDFSEDKVGNFARRLKYKSGPVEVVERDGIKVLRSTGRSEFLIPVGRKLPERFTFEMDIIAPQPKDGEHDPHGMLTFEGGPEEDQGAQSASVMWMTSLAWIAGGGQSSPSSNVKPPATMPPLLRGNVAHLRVLMDGAYFKMYVNERRLYNIPELAFRRDSAIRIALNVSEEEPLYFTSLRVAESETDVLYDALATKGRWATQGILFATGKAELQPESRPVLKEIAATLKEHGDLKILIEGHTDNVGSAASNLTLSDARAAAVKAALVADFGIAADRMSTKGFGDTKPSVPNATAEGRAQNRRVEIVKQ